MSLQSGPSCQGAKGANVGLVAADASSRGLAIAHAGACADACSLFFCMTFVFRYNLRPYR